MVLSASDTVVSTVNHTEESYDNLDIVMTAQQLHQLKFMSVEESESITGKEKQILVDPISLRESSGREASFNLMLPPVVLKPPIISCSLPNSATSSPRFSFSLLKKKKWKNESQASPRQIDRFTYRNSGAEQDEFGLRRSKSCAEWRSWSAPADELDLWFRKQNSTVHHTRHHRNPPEDDQKAEEFKCSALCMYVPGFSRRKPVRPKKERVEADHIGNVISRTVSLEKFECGSWASSAIINDQEDGDSMNLYFDLPMELIKSSVNDATAPVSAAFVFDRERKGVLKSGSRRAEARKLHESSRHVRFSSSSSSPTSPASCITPRLRKARQDFNAFLEAQSA